MSRTISPTPRRGDPARGPGDRRPERRIVIFIVVVVFAAAMLAAGCSLQSVLATVLGVGLAGATIARWVVDGAPLPTLDLRQAADGGRG